MGIRSKTLLQLILVMPATNVTSERSFSSVRRIKAYFRSTMKQDGLNNSLDRKRTTGVLPILPLRFSKPQCFTVSVNLKLFVGNQSHPFSRPLYLFLLHLFLPSFASIFVCLRSFCRPIFFPDIATGRRFGTNLSLEFLVFYII